MFPESRMTCAFSLLLGCLLFTAAEGVVRLQDLEGNPLTLHTALPGFQNAHIRWFYGLGKTAIKIVDSQILTGEIKTEYPSDRFRDRLQLDRSSGSLTIRNINREDSGDYELHSVTGSFTVQSFSLKVYALVSKPAIKEKKAGRHSGGQVQPCCNLCSVENGEDVTLTWLKDNKTISKISSTSSDGSLHLPLCNVTHLCGCIYTCVAANSVSSQPMPLTDFCSLKTGGATSPTAVGLTVIALLMMWSTVWF